MTSRLIWYGIFVSNALFRYDKFDELKITAKKMNIPIFILPSSKGNQYLYIQKCYVDAIWEQMKQNIDTALPEQKQDKPANKRRSR